MDNKFKLTDAGRVHNYLCDKILEIDNKELVLSTELLLKYLEICAKELLYLFPADNVVIINAIEQAKTYFKSFDEDENGTNKLFSQHIYSYNFIVDFTARYKCPAELSSLLIELHRLCFDTRSEKSKFNDIINKIKDIAQSESKDNFLDVYDASFHYWHDKERMQMKKEHPPEGVTCSEWVIIMDAIGGLAPAPLGAILGAIFSIAAERECEDRQEQAVTKKSSIYINISDAFYMESIFPKKVFIDDKYIGRFVSRRKVFEKPENAKNVRIEILGGLIKSDCDLPEIKGSLAVDFTGYYYRIMIWLFVYLSFYLFLDLVFFRIVPTYSIVFLLTITVYLLPFIFLFVFRKKRYRKNVHEV